VKHYFINSHSIHDDFNAGAFAAQAEELLDELFKTNDYVVLCGGSGLYVRALLNGFDEIPDVPKEIRQSIIEGYEENGLAWLQAAVLEADPEFYSVADKLNPQRLMRALEVFNASGKPFSSFKSNPRKELPFNVITLGLDLPRPELYERIDKRMDDMIASGLFEEAESLYPLKHLNALQTVGYQEIFDFMDGKYNRDEAIRLLKRNSRRYAKRQFTWFKSDSEINWFHPTDYDGIVKFVTEKSAIL
jgi:tRNA dimethylallyltransferase